MNRFKIASLITLLFTFTLLASITGCKKDSEKVAPAIPPESSFVMDFTGFTNPADTSANRETGSYLNWGYSYLNVVSWNAVLTASLAVPVAAFKESFNHQGVFHPDQNNWKWSYNVTSNNSIYEAELTGKVLADSIQWEMRITRDNVYSDFLWFHGKSAIDQSGGYWILMDNPLASITLLQIDWNKYTSDLADIRYTNIVPANSDNGSYIFYGVTTGDYNRFYEIYKRSVSNLTDIEWNAETLIGRVKDQQHFGDDLWHCWDNILLDSSCQ